MCPPEVDVACHNSPESSTISGPSDIMHAFVAKLMGQGVFAKEVPCSNIAYHSRYIKDAGNYTYNGGILLFFYNQSTKLVFHVPVFSGPGLLKYLKEVIKNPKTRSKRWLSTSVPAERWNEPAAKLCSSEYLTNNLLVRFYFIESPGLLRVSFSPFSLHTDPYIIHNLCVYVFYRVLYYLKRLQS